MGALQLKVLSDAEIEKLHEKTLVVLERVGVNVTHDEALRKLKKRGARVNEANGLVRFPRKLVKELLEAAPPVARGTGLNGKVLEVGGSNRYHTSLILDPFIVDYHDGVRKPVLEDVRRHTIIGQSLDRIDLMMRMQYPVSDIPEPDCYYKTMEVFLTHTTKNIAVYPSSEQNCRDWMEAMEVIADAAGLDPHTTPLIYIAMAVTSPLQVHGMNIEIMKMAMERTYPIVSTVCPMAGTTSPYSVAGTALQSNAEALVPVLIAQAYKPGHPVMYSVGPSVTDMQQGHDLYYKPEKMLFKLIGCQMGKFYRLPLCGEAGGTSTHRPDVQNGAEGFAYLLASYCGGQNIIGGFGSNCNAVGMSGEQIIMQCGIADMVEYVARGVDLSDEKMGIESLERTGPGGNFLADDLTLALLRSGEFFSSPFVDLTGGYVAGAPGMYEIAHQKADDLVNNFKPVQNHTVAAAIKDFFRKKYLSPQVADL